MSRKKAKRLNRIRIKKKYTLCILFSISVLFVVVKKVIFRSQSGTLSFFNAYGPGHEFFFCFFFVDLFFNVRLYNRMSRKKANV